MDVKEVLRKAVEEHASDIFIIAGLPISYRSNNVIIKEEGERLMPPETENYLEQIYELADHRDIDRLLKHAERQYSAVSLSMMISPLRCRDCQDSVSVLISKEAHYQQWFV